MIVLKLIELGLNGHMIAFIINFLNNGSIKVKIGNYLSDIRTLKNGLLQGTVFAVVLFLIAINDIISEIDRPVTGTWSADDGAIIMIGKKNINTCIEIAQTTLNKLSEWCKKTGYKFSTDESEFMIFTRLNKVVY